MTAWITAVFVLLLAACGGGSSGSSGTTTPPPTCTNSCPTSGMRDITSLELSRQMGVGWNLGNSLEAIGGETAWGNPPVTQAMMDAVKAAGFTTIRIPLSWEQYADANDQISATWMARVTQVVGYAHNAGLYTIINIHWDGGWMQPTYAAQASVNARLTKFWTQIATNFRDADDTLLFAGTNEVGVEGDYGPPTAENAAVQNGFNQVFVNAVRATGGNNAVRHLVVQSYLTNIDDAVSFTKLPTDTVANRMMLEVHFYDPYDFTLNTSSNAIWQWGATATDPNAVEAWGNEPHVDEQFQKMKAAFIDLGVPVILGEYSATSRTDVPGSEAYRLAWDQYITESAVAHGLVPVYWDSGATDNHTSGLFDRSTGAQAFPDIVSAIVAAGH
jgi:endoglucanase